VKTRPWLLAAGLWLCCAAGGKTLHAQDRWPELLQQWVVAVSAHVPGEDDQALSTIAAWPREDLQLARPWIRVLALVATDRFQGKLKRGEIKRLEELALQARGSRDGNDFVKRAALLHSDIAMAGRADRAPVAAPALAPPSPSRPTGPRGRIMVRGPDGLFDGFELGSLHWDYARDLLDAVGPSPSTDETVSIWYRTIAGYLLGAYSFGEAQSHFARGRALLPDDAGLLYADGCRQESLGSPRIQDFVRTTVLPNQLTFMGVTNATDQLRKADELFRLALERDRDLTEARLHHARVLFGLRRHADALQELQVVRTETKDAVILFFVHLFTGDAELARGHEDLARASYELAMQLYPRSQSARLALSHLARSRGDRNAAIQLLLPSATLPSENRGDDDPWWEYYACDGRELDSWLERLRAPFVAPERR
jgi:tetratricopeptide (TPR) repeat protein